MQEIRLSRRARMLKPSATLAITAKAKALRAQGVDVIGFGAGEPDFDTPETIKRRAVEAIEQGFTKYTPVGGIEELKEAIIRRFADDYGLTYQKNEISVACGAKHSLYNIAQVLFDEGDEVVIPAPYWVSYPEQVRLAGAEPRIVVTHEDEGFKLTPDALRRAITPRTRALILNYPSNPTGATYTRRELEGLVEVALEAGLWIVSDEIYDKIIYPPASHTPVAALGDEVKRATLFVNGVSKSYSMTGWRIGFAAGDARVIAAMNNLQGQCTSNPASISQVASVEAFSGSQDVVREMVAEFAKRKDYIVGRLNAVPGIECFDPQGAFYVFPNVSSLFGRSTPGGRTIENSVDFTEYLLEEAKVAVVPGIEFGAEGYVRISYATSMDNIVEGMDRIEKAVAKLS